MVDLPANSLDAREDIADVVAEADVEHPVHFVEHDKADVLEVDDPPVQQVDDPPGRADEDLGVVLQELHLGGDLLPAIDRRRCGWACTGRAA